MFNKHFIKYLIGFGALLLVVEGCGPIRFVPEELDEDFESSDKTAEELVADLPMETDRLDRIEGRARAQISSPKGSDRATVDFKADREQSLFTLRNSLGIEGGRMLADRDSVLIYDRIESTAYKLSHDQAQSYYLQGMTAINLLDVLQPDFSETDKFSLFESETSYVMVSEDNTQYYFDRSDLYLQQITYPEEFGYPFSEIHFTDYEDFDGKDLPIRIQILSSDKETSILLQLRSVTSNPDELSFDPDIPSDITVQRI